MKRLPLVSTATVFGESRAAVAGPPSPLKPDVPSPATVEMTPSGVILRMRLDAATKRLPAPSAATPVGEEIWAAVAGPPSPLKPDVPSPATVEMTPSGVILRMRLDVATK